jgi:hypothetical protein
MGATQFLPRVVGATTTLVSHIRSGREINFTILNSYQDELSPISAIVVEAGQLQADETNDGQLAQPVEIGLCSATDALPESTVQLDPDLSDSQRDSAEPAENDSVLGANLQVDDAKGPTVNSSDHIENFETEYNLLIWETNVSPSKATSEPKELSSDGASFVCGTSVTEQMTETLLAANPPPTPADSDLSAFIRDSNCVEGEAATVFQPLEALRGPNGGVDSEQSPFVFTADSQNNALTLRLNPHNPAILELLDNNSGEVLVSQLLAETKGVSIVGTDQGDDRLVIDFSIPFWSEAVTFEGGAGGYDSLILRGDKSVSVEYDAVAKDAGTIELFDGALRTTIHFTGLEPAVYINDFGEVINSGVMSYGNSPAILRAYPNNPEQRNVIMAQTK